MGTNKERRRHRTWPESLKREIVAATLTPGSSVSLVARRYDVNANQVFAWRRRYRSGSVEPAGVQLVPVTVTPDQPIPIHFRPSFSAASIAVPQPQNGSRIVSPSLEEDRMMRSRSAASLRLVLDVLERR